MKKLMIALAAVATAFGLRAADTGFVSGAGFDTSDTANPANGVYTWLNNTSGIEGTGFVDGYWSDSVSNATVKAETYTYTGGHPAQFDPAEEIARNYDQYVSIQTSFGNPVAMNINPSGTTSYIGDGFYYDSLVNLTACDEAPAFDNYTDAKIYVYAKQNDPEDDTAGANIYVAAADAEGAVKEYRTATAFVEGWHRLTVKMIKSVLKGAETDVGFVVFVDGQAVNSTEAGSAFSAAETLALTAAAKKWFNLGQLFRSLAKATDEVKGVAFDGKGDIDEVAFTTTAPSFAADAQFFSVAWDDTIESVSVNDAELTSNPQDIEFLAGSTYTYVAKEGYVSKTTATAFEELAAGKEYSLTADPAKASYTIGGVTTYVADLATAVAAVNGASENATLKLGADAGAIEINNANADVEITLDLAGKKVEAATSHAIAVTGGALKIVDTVTGGKVVGLTTEGEEPTVYNAVYANGGAVTIEAGIYDGKVAATKKAGSSILINGGSFKAADNDKAALDKYAKEGFEFTQAAGSDYLELTKKQDEPFSGGTGAIDDPYLISKVADLVVLQTKVAAGDNFEGKYFKQTTDIAMPNDEFAGIGFYGENASPAIANIPFSGNYDGQNYRITNVHFNNYKYAGFFNVTEGATIENLTIDVVSKAGKGGAVFVGYAVDSTLRNLTATGTFGTTDKPLTHNGAGIASDVAGVTLIESCTNKASIVLNYTKAGGMVAFEGEKTVISEDLSTTNKYADLTIRNCSNEGTITVTAPGDNYNSIGGLVGWAGYGSTTIEGSRNTAALVLNGSETESKTADKDRLARSNTHGAGGLIGVGGGKKFVIVDSVNSGTVTYHKRCAVLPYLALGGIIGNAGSPTIAMTNVVSSGELVVNQEAGCTAEERVGAFIGNASSTTFAVGGTNVGAAALPSIGKASVTVDGLTYATVSGSEATYIADDELAASGTYKVMLAGAAPTFEFTGAGTIAFNTNLCEVANFDGITVADGSGLVITPSEEDGIVTFTAAAAPQPEGWPENPETVAGQAAGVVYGETLPTALANADAATVATWAKGVGAVAFADKASINTDAFLLNIDNASTAEQIQAAKDAFKITGFAQSSDGTWVVTLTDPNGGTVYADGTYGNGKVVVESFSDVTCTTPATSGDQLFYKAKLVVKEVSAQ